MYSGDAYFLDCAVRHNAPLLRLKHFIHDGCGKSGKGGIVYVEVRFFDLDSGVKGLPECLHE
jgi:hypothetical protein